MSNMQLLQARRIAVDICYLLQPYCSKINIAGSIRRQKAEVKDIEIVCLPIVTEMTDLFGAVIKTQRSELFFNECKKLGTSVKGNPGGKYMQISLPSGVNLDLFMPEAADYFRQYAIRTGSADYSYKVIAAAWKRKGWCGSDLGLRKMIDCLEIKTPDGKSKWKCVNSAGEIPPVWESEEVFFSWLGVDYLPPKYRNF